MPGARNLPERQPRTLHVRTILAWADAHQRQTGRYPHRETGLVDAAPQWSWRQIDRALQSGAGGLPGGDTLQRLLARRRRVTRPHQRPRLTLKKIVAWSDAYRRLTRRRPSLERRDPVPGGPGETWHGINQALVAGVRGLPGGDSLAKVLGRYRGVRRTVYRPLLSSDLILRWADAHFRRTRRWPVLESGPVHGARGETWAGVRDALYRGARGLSKGFTLASLLAAQRGVRYRRALEPYKVHRILAWADAHRRRAGALPRPKSGPIPEAPGETWSGVEHALIRG
jgi:hypothetical protein